MKSMTKSILPVFLVCLLVIVIGCGKQHTLKNIVYNKTNHIFELGSEQVQTLETEREKSQALNKALTYAPPLDNNLSSGGFKELTNSYDSFMMNYSKIITMAYADTSYFDILFSFAVGYTISESILNDIDTFDAKSRKDITNYSGIGFSEYVLIHSFWVTFHYLNGNNTKTPIPFEGNKLRTGLDAKPGIVQIAKASLKMVEIIANEGKNTPGYRLLYFEDDRLFKNTITFLEDGGLSSQISRKLCYNRFLEVGLVNQFVCQNILKKENKNILLGDIFTTTNNYFYNASSALGKAKSGQLLNSMQDLFWNRIVGGEIDIDFYNDWSAKRH